MSLPVFFCSSRIEESMGEKSNKVVTFFSAINSIAEAVKVNNNIVTIKGVDILDGTPLLDIKPYIENFDKVEGEAKSGWMKSSSDEVKTMRSDKRFIK